jgi:hypothetical protein
MQGFGYNPLKDRVIEHRYHIMTKLLDSHSQCGLALSSLSPLLKGT